MSQPSRSRSGARQGEARGIARAAARSTWGPPGWGRARSRAVLSKASPGASSIVPPSRAKLSGPVDPQELAVAAGHQQQEIGKRPRHGSAGGSAHGPRDGSPPMSGFPRGGGQRLRGHHPRQHAADQTGAGGDGDRVDLLQRHAGLTPVRPRWQRSTFSAWARAAISGTTPPKGACRSLWPSTTDDRMLRPRRTAAAVSSAARFDAEDEGICHGPGGCSRDGRA